jgi:hypothetical protein
LGQDDFKLQLNATSVSSDITSWLSQVAQGYDQDPSAKKLLSCLLTGETMEHYTLSQGIIRFKGRIWIGANKAIQQMIMSELHEVPLVATLDFQSQTVELNLILHGQA